MVQLNAFRIAVKACIVAEAKILLIQRRKNDPHKPGTWDIPGGRLEIAEDPQLGLKREVREEVGLEIDIVLPVAVQHFTRDDGQKITMLIFLCRPHGIRVKLSHEHIDQHWVSLNANPSHFPDWIQPVIYTINTFSLATHL